MNIRAAAVIAPLILVGSCYTRFASFEPDAVTPERVTTYIDSSGKVVRVVERIDTVKAAEEKETCIWERDLIGLPYLRCYKGYYPSQWYHYNYSPWWYQGAAHVYNPEYCPPYYYYDKNCGCCRYYLNNPDLAAGQIAPKQISPKPNTPPPSAPDPRITKTALIKPDIFSATSGVVVQPKPHSGQNAKPVVGALPAKSDSLASDTAKDSASAKAQVSGTKPSDSSVEKKTSSNAPAQPAAATRPLRRSTRGRE